MASLILLAVLTYLIYYVCNTLLCFRRNLKRAKQSGLTYVVLPVYYLSPWWLVIHPLCLPLLAKLPRRWTAWVDFCIPDFCYQSSIEVFQRVGQDTFLTVAPGGIALHTAEPAVISQITARRNDFPKPTAIYRSLDIYGKNVVSTEGTMWRQHRKAVSPPFTEKNNHLVWSESIGLAEAMLASWVGPDGKGDQTVDRVMDDTMRLSLYVISRAGFGRKIEWPSPASTADVDTDYVDKSKIQNQQDDRDPGHSMSYIYAIHCLLDNILFQFLLPRWIVARAPIKALQKANEAYNEWGNYMREAVASKRESLRAGAEDSEQMDIISQLVKNQVTSEKSDGAALSESDILGNMFVLILAGHETAANSIHFSLLYLALYPESQRAVQADLDRIFQGKPPSEWDYDRDLPSLFGGMVGAVLAEELRLVPPVIGIPKSTIGSGEQSLTVGGKQCTIPGGTYISLATSNVQRNPKYWPTRKPTRPGGHPVHPRANLDNDLEEFRPQRWLLDDEGEVQTAAGDRKRNTEMPSEAVTNDGLAVNEAADTSEQLYRPQRGAYVPFSDGYRACIGRRFAQVEVLAVLAVLLQKYTVELAVDHWATDEEVVTMDEDALAEVWQKAAEHARNLLLTGLGVIISLQMRKGHVSLRFMPRGKERFPDDVDERWKQKHPDMCQGDRSDPHWRFWG